MRQTIIPSLLCAVIGAGLWYLTQVASLSRQPDPVPVPAPIVPAPPPAPPKKPTPPCPGPGPCPRPKEEEHACPVQHAPGGNFGLCCPNCGPQLPCPCGSRGCGCNDALSPYRTMRAGDALPPALALR
jgi:hypothetical protein